MAEQEQTGRVIPIAIEDEVKTSYLNYAMSVIVSRALPDVRDGLKPVHRRILYAMSDMGLRSDRPFKKSGRIVGDVLGKYHPHGDQSIYDALVRLAQDFSMRYMMVDGQGNYGSVDGDPPAAMRYTEARLKAEAEELLRDIKKETVDFIPNYDDSMEEPSVLPGAFPFLLANGATGIAVGMATTMAPHNLREVAAAIGAVIDNPEIELSELMQHIKGPDFPTGGIIYGRRGIRDAFETGRGRVVVRASFSIESTKAGKDVILIHEIPFLVNKATLITRIADLVRDRKIDGITDLRDESDRNGMRIVIELKKGASPKIILNQLFTHTQLQINFNINALALVNGRPKLLPLKETIEHFIAHRREVVIRRTKFDLRKAEEREHILEGLKIALDNIDEVIKTIKESADVETARNALMEKFALSQIQAQAILDMRLQKLTSLETQKIIDELAEVRALIAELRALLASEQKILGVVKQETIEISDKYGDDRRTEIVADEIEAIDIEDLIQKEDMVVLISHRGYMKRVPLSAYRLQGRGGKGSSSSNLMEDDFIQHLFVGSTHDYILFATSEGKAYWLKVHEIPEASRAARGQHVRGILSISANEEITAVVRFPEFSPDKYLFMGTARGVVKKARLSDFSNAKTRGITAINLDDNDRLIKALLTDGNGDVMLVTRRGNGLRIDEESVRVMGRATRGVQGIRLTDADELAGVVAVTPDESLLFITEYGHGKRTNFDDFNPHGRGTRGQIAYSLSDKTGELVGVIPIREDDEVIVITSQGSTVKLKVSQITVQSRTASGVRVVNIDRPDYVVGIGRAENDDE
ncbi:MAG: DNA topoisomerase (ATP-hydrolyzing) subunit A [Spirochaetaceae bacterium]|nr:MAG: DNA topoisomerase (ATP-hydrolyzing) subunit A [Spirochaetaceae bacterium]